ncbi:MAG: type II toxin-antitoxin system VapC family toxin [Xanthobacteraceae bacterium]|jgi:predicted nucleic acid-binding protein
MSVEDFAPSGRALLVPDTNVYIGAAAGTLPALVQDLVERALLFHCSVCLGELATGIANANPSLPSWSALRDHYLELFDSIPSARLLNPDAQVWTDAGVVAGVLARTQGFQRHQRKECLNDALIYLTAAKAGLPVLTADNHQFDLIQRLAPEGQFIHF